mmetsp:Transcript_27314/g.39560  ORF Transcript_27314/g.39560 Transcript_27314/m.39560 type:complete len:380 (+) Transcript_27314:106-1245(+)
MTPIQKKMQGRMQPTEVQQHLMHEHYWKLDDNFRRMEEFMLQTRGLTEFGHARTTFKTHLVGTFALCAAWGLPQAAARCGLFHTAYSGDLFRFCLFSSEKSEDRVKLRGVIGEEGERLVHLFGGIRRQCLMETVYETGSIREINVIPWNRQGERELYRCDTVEVIGRDAAYILMVTVADYLDQLTGCNAWKDIYQVDADDQVMLWPGSGKPGVAFHWLMKLAKAAAPYLLTVPELFKKCTAAITEEDETKARDSYWEVVRDDDMNTLSDKEKIEKLEVCLQLNRFVGEPHVLLAQIYFRNKQWEEAITHCKQGLVKMYALCTAWDKRMPWNEWVAFTRITWLRASRLVRGLPDFPRATNGLCRLEEMLDEIEDLERYAD